MLADMAVNDPAGFAALCEVAKNAKPKAKVVENVVVLKTLSKEEKAAAPKAAPAKKAEKAAPAKAEKKEEVKAAPKAAEDLNSKTVAELKEMAKAAGISGISTMKKADLIAALSK